MLKQSWEAYATSLANADTDDALLKALENIVQKEGINLSAPANIVIARDTR